MPFIISKEDRVAKFSKWFWVFKQVELFKPDIIHSNTEFIIAEFGFLYGKLYNVPFIYTFHTMWEDYGKNYFPMVPSFLLRLFTRNFLRTILNRSYKVIVPTLQVQEAVKKYGVKKEIFLLPTGIDPEFFEHDRAEAAWFREQMEGRYPALKGRRILLFAGRVTKEKNIGFLLNIMPAVLAKHPEAVLLVAGDGPDSDYFREEAEALGIGDHCVFTGYMDRKDLAITYTMSEIFVFPSLTETQGLVTREAMLSGTPVVAIGEMGTIMVMGGDNGGFMVKNDPEEFTARVFDLLEDPALCRSKAAEAKRHAQSWSIDKVTQRLEKIYRETIDSYRRENGESRPPVWELLMEKGWWKINNKTWWNMPHKQWQKILARLK
jgi:glycosyltransferase involved in cell wall biosynthesis